MPGIPDAADLCLERAVGQLFAVGIPGTEVGPRARELVAEYGVGTVVYFDRNVQAPGQVRALSDRLQELAPDPVPVLIATDQEGGSVARIPFGGRPPPAMAVGAAGDPELARELGRAVADQLRAVGVNANFAPVLDVNVNPDNPVIGVRSFGDDPTLVGELGTAVVEGLQEGDVLACGKHFPGHGDTTVDSHRGLPVVDHDRERLDRVELPPFEAAIATGVDAVMTAHVGFPAIEPDPSLPATLSERVLVDLLREELGHDGLAVTDCMEMDAIADGVGTVEGTVEAIAAGADLVLVSHSHDRQTAAIEATIGAVRSGELAESRVREAAGRVLRVKERRLTGASATTGDRDRSDAIEGGSSTIADVTQRIARRAVTLVGDRGDVIPLTTGPVPVLAAGSSEPTRVEGDGDPQRAADTLAEALADDGVETERVRAGVTDAGSGDPAGEASGDAQPIPGDGAVIGVLTGFEGDRDRPDVESLRSVLAAGRPVVLVAADSPYDLRAFPGAAAAVATYGPDRTAMWAAADALSGRRRASGTLPVEVDPP